MHLRLQEIAAGLLLMLAAPAAGQTVEGRFGSPARFVPQTGEGVYADVCQGCHMPGGVGAAGAAAYPALAGDARLATAAYPLAMVMRGQKGMPPFASLLSDEQVAAVVNYIRSHFGNSFSDAVTAADAKAVR